MGGTVRLYLLQVMVLTKVIYADVLVVLNTYVTYVLLLMTEVASHERSGRLRRALSALVGGLSALLLLLPDMNETALSLIRLPLAAVIVLVAYGKGKMRRFIRLYAAYFAVNFIFAGLMLALWYFISPSLYFNSGIVYFSVDSLTLILLTAVCWLLVRLVMYFIGRKVPSARMYGIEIFVAERVIACKGFLDTGHSLRDPFTDFPVVIISLDRLTEVFPEVETPSDLGGIEGIKARYLPCSTVTGEDVLMGFRPEKIRVKGVSIAFETDGVVVAVTEKKLMGGEYGALLPQKLFENKTDERGEDYVITA